MSALNLLEFEKAAHVRDPNVLAWLAGAALAVMTSGFVARHLLSFPGQARWKMTSLAVVLRPANQRSL